MRHRDFKLDKAQQAIARGCLWNVVYGCLVIQVITVLIVIGIAFRSSSRNAREHSDYCRSLIFRPATTSPHDEGKLQAFVTLVSDEQKHPRSGLSYADSAMVMLHKLRELHGDNYKYVAVVTPDISVETIHRFQKLHVTVEVLQKITPQIPTGLARWKDAYTKLWVWGLEEYSKVVYLDADHLIVKKMDHLFSYPELAAVYEDNGAFIAAMFVLVPDTAKMNAMFVAMEHSSGCYKDNQMDQTFLNWYFAESWHEVPYEYSSRMMTDDSPSFSDTRAFHGKFFQSDDGCHKCQELFLQQWRVVANITRG